MYFLSLNFFQADASLIACLYNGTSSRVVSAFNEFRSNEILDDVSDNYTCHEFHANFHHVLFHEKTHFLILAGSAFYQI